MDEELITTIEPQVIKQWIEDRGGRPAKVHDEADADAQSILRIDFERPGSNLNIHEISWTDFFNLFEENNLAFKYQGTLETGELSKFYEIVKRQT